MYCFVAYVLCGPLQSMTRKPGNRIKNLKCTDIREECKAVLNNNYVEMCKMVCDLHSK